MSGSNASQQPTPADIVAALLREWAYDDTTAEECEALLRAAEVLER